MKNKRIIATLLALAFALGSTSALSALAEATISEADPAPASQPQDVLSDTSGPIRIDEAVTPGPDPEQTPDADQTPDTDQTPDADQTPDDAQTPGPDDADPVTPEAPAETPHFARGYLYVDAGTIIYADAGREIHLGVMPARQIVYARCVGIYEHGCLYEIHFDTDRTAGTEQEQIGYFYTGRPQITSADEAVGERIAEGIGLVPYADLYYEEQPEQTDGPEESADDAASTNTNSVNIRREPSRSSDIVAQLTQGTKVTILEAVTNAQGELWYKVTCEAGKGYIRADLIQTSEPEAPVEDEAPEAAETDDSETSDIDTADAPEAADDTADEPEIPAQPPVILDADQAADADAAITKEGESDEEDVSFGDTAETDEVLEPAAEADEILETDETADIDEAADTDENADTDGTADVNETADTDDTDAATPSEADADTDGTADPDVTADEPEKLLDPDATNPDRSISITASWGEKALEYGDTVTLSAELSGYEGLEIEVFWQCDKGAGFEDCPDTVGQSSFQFVVDETNAAWIWRAGVVITMEEPAPALTLDEAATDAGEDPAETTETTDEPAAETAAEA